MTLSKLLKYQERGFAREIMGRTLADRPALALSALTPQWRAARGSPRGL